VVETLIKAPFQLTGEVARAAEPPGQAAADSDAAAEPCDDSKPIEHAELGVRLSVV
jgi:hypothetical protein